MATVLIADDEFGIAALLKDVLEDEGFGVILAANGKQALERSRISVPTSFSPT